MPQGKRGGRGFAGMDEERQREIARMGGRAAHEKGSAHEFSSDEAREAGRKGGLATSRDREHMSAIGREGAEARSEQRRVRPEGTEDSEEEEENGPARVAAPKTEATAITVLRQDHARVAALFDEFEDADIPAERRRLVEEIGRQIEVHTRLEEQIFYPAVRDARVAGGRALVHDAEMDHAAAELALAELDEMEPTDPSYETKVLALKELVDHHANQEEAEMFPLAQKEIAASRLQDLAAQMQILRATLQTRFS
jgi:general stress protein YciG/hemerythrin superfamily protein